MSSMHFASSDLTRSGKRAGERNGTIDLFRLIASLAIVEFHVGMIPNGVTLTGLPFFVALLVYYGASRKPAERVQRLMTPWLFWAVVYFVLLVGQQVLRFEPPLGFFEPWMLGVGPSLHLWFLPFSAGFLILVAALPFKARLYTLLFLGVLAIALVQFVDLPKPFTQWFAVLPMAVVGYLMSRADHPWLVSLAACAISFCLLLSPYSVGALQMFWASAFLTLALVCPIPATKLTSELGALSLGIYLVHPMLIAGLERAFQLAEWPLVVGTCAASLVSTFVLRRYLPRSVI